ANAGKDSAEFKKWSEKIKRGAFGLAYEAVTSAMQGLRDLTRPSWLADTKIDLKKFLENSDNNLTSPAKKLTQEDLLKSYYCTDQILAQHRALAGRKNGARTSRAANMETGVRADLSRGSSAVSEIQDIEKTTHIAMTLP